MNDFSLREDTVTYVLQVGLSHLPAPSLPFEILGIYVEALDHTKPSHTPIVVQSRKGFVRSHSGKPQKIYEFTIGNSYYQLGKIARRDAICGALISMAENLHKEFPSSDGHALASQIRSIATTNASASPSEC